MRILLVDDDSALAETLAGFLGVARPGWEVRVAADGAGALDLLRSGTVDLLVTDIQMPGIDGISLLERLRGDPDLSGLPVILASGRSHRDEVREGMASGADDYLTKPYTGEELLQAIEARHRRLHLAQGHAEAHQDREHLGRLTDRERDVIALIGQGLVTKEIAQKLDLSPHTVSVHRARIMRKLDLHTASALAALAARARLR